MHLISYANVLVSDFAFKVEMNMSYLIYVMAHLVSRAVVISVNHFSSAPDVTAQLLKTFVCRVFCCFKGYT